MSKISFGLAVIVAIMVAVAVAQEPTTYSTTMTYFVPREQGLGFLAVYSGLAEIGVSDNEMLIKAVLGSNEFKLRLAGKTAPEIWEGRQAPETREAIIDLVNKRLSVGSPNLGVIKIRALTGNARLSLRIGQAVTSLLADYFKSRRNEKKGFFDAEIERTNEMLAKKEVELLRIQRESGLLDPATAAPEIQRILLAEQTESNALEGLWRASCRRLDAPGAIDTMLGLKAEQVSIEERLRTLRSRIDQTKTRFEALPRRTLDYVKTQREMKLLNDFLEVVYKEHEAERIKSAQTLLPFEVIEPGFEATMPERKHIVAKAVLAFLIVMLMCQIVIQLLGNRVRSARVELAVATEGPLST